MVLGIVLGVYQGIADDLTAAETSGGVLPIHELLIEAFIPFEAAKKTALEQADAMDNLMDEALDSENAVQLDQDDEGLQGQVVGGMPNSLAGRYSDKTPIRTTELEATLSAKDLDTAEKPAPKLNADGSAYSASGVSAYLHEVGERVSTERQGEGKPPLKDGQTLPEAEV